MKKDELVKGLRQRLLSTPFIDIEKVNAATDDEIIDSFVTTINDDGVRHLLERVRQKNACIRFDDVLDLM